MLSELPPVNNTKTYNCNDGAVRFDDAALFSAQGEFNGGKLEVEISRNSEDLDSIRDIIIVYFNRRSRILR